MLSKELDAALIRACRKLMCNYVITNANLALQGSKVTLSTEILSEFPQYKYVLESTLKYL